VDKALGRHPYYYNIYFLFTKGALGEAITKLHCFSIACTHLSPALWVLSTFTILRVLALVAGHFF